MSAPEKTAAEQLATPVQFLKGVGPARAELLDRLGLHYRPRRPVLLPPRLSGPQRPAQVDQLEEGKLQSVRGVVEDIDLRNTSTGGCILGVLIRCRTRLPAGHLVQPALHARPLQTRPAGDALRQAEDTRGWSGRWHHPRVEVLDEEEEEPVTKILPVYPLTEGLQQWQIRQIVRGRWKRTPTARRGLSCRVPGSHDLAAAAGVAANPLPQRAESLDRARRRLVYQELFILQLGPWPSGGSSSTTSGRPRPWRPRPRSTPASAGSSPSS